MRKLIFGVILSLAGATPAFAADTSVGVNFMFNDDGFQGAGMFVGIDRVEMHASKLNDINWALGVGYRVLDSESLGMSGDDPIGTSLSLGGSYVVGGEAPGFRPYGQVNVEIDAIGDSNLNLGAISYGMNLTEFTNNYLYGGIAYEHHEDNRSPVMEDSRAAASQLNGDGGDDGGESDPDYCGASDIEQTENSNASNNPGGEAPCNEHAVK